MKKYISPDFLIALNSQGINKSTIIALSKNIPTTDIFEAVQNNEITSKDAANILMWKKLSLPWYVRLFKYLFPY